MERRQAEEQYLALLREAERRQADDPLADFTPHPKQKEFIDAVLDGKTRHAWFIASNRSGKSDAGSYIGSYFARYGNRANAKPDSYGKIQVTDYATSGWVVSLDFPTSRDIIQPKYFDNGFVSPGSHPPFIPDREIAEWRVTDQVLKLKNGSIVGFKSSDSPRTKFQGTEKDWIHFDEEPPKGHFEECIIRVGKRPLTIFATCTLLPPEGELGGVTWVFSEIIKPWQKGELPHVMLFGASIYDNPYIGREEIALLEAAYAPGSLMRRIRLDGEWLPGMLGARAYGNFDFMRHVREQPPPKDMYPLCWLFDFNVTPFISLVGTRDGSLFRIHKEYCLDGGTHSEMAQHFYQDFVGHRGEIWIYGDATGQNRGQTGKTDYALVLNEIRKYNMIARLKVPSSNPHVPDRINAVNRALRNEQGVHMLEIDPSCKELIEDLEQVIRDPAGGIKKVHNPRDTYFRRTHASDALGYWIAFEQPVVFNPRKVAMLAKSRIKSPDYAFTGNHG